MQGGAPHIEIHDSTLTENEIKIITEIENLNKYSLIGKDAEQAISGLLQKFNQVATTLDTIGANLDEQRQKLIIRSIEQKMLEANKEEFINEFNRNQPHFSQVLQQLSNYGLQIRGVEFENEIYGEYIKNKRNISNKEKPSVKDVIIINKENKKGTNHFNYKLIQYNKSLPKRDRKGENYYFTMKTDIGYDFSIITYSSDNYKQQCTVFVNFSLNKNEENLRLFIDYVNRRQNQRFTKQSLDQIFHEININKIVTSTLNKIEAKELMVDKTIKKVEDTIDKKFKKIIIDQYGLDASIQIKWAYNQYQNTKFEEGQRKIFHKGALRKIENDKDKLMAEKEALEVTGLKKAYEKQINDYRNQITNLSNEIRIKEEQKKQVDEFYRNEINKINNENNDRIKEERSTFLQERERIYKEMENKINQIKKENEHRIESLQNENKNTITEFKRQITEKNQEHEKEVNTLKKSFKKIKESNRSFSEMLQKENQEKKERIKELEKEKDDLINRINESEFEKVGLKEKGKYIERRQDELEETIRTLSENKNSNDLHWQVQGLLKQIDDKHPGKHKLFGEKANIDKVREKIHKLQISKDTELSLDGQIMLYTNDYTKAKKYFTDALTINKNNSNAAIGNIIADIGIQLDKINLNIDRLRNDTKEATDLLILIGNLVEEEKHSKAEQYRINLEKIKRRIKRNKQLNYKEVLKIEISINNISDSPNHPFEKPLDRIIDKIESSKEILEQISL